MTTNQIGSNIDTTLAKINQNNGKTLDQFQKDLINSLSENNQIQNDDQLSKNLKLATMFNVDPYISTILLDSVNNSDIQSSTKLLTNLFTQRDIYLNTQNDSVLRGNRLRQSIIDQIDDEKMKQQQQKIEDEYINTMIEFDMMQYFNSMLDFGSKEKDKHKDSSYGFLFSDFYTQNQLLYNQYNDLKDMNKIMLNQYTNYNLDALL
jgi:hypothetical protein